MRGDMVVAFQAALAREGAGGVVVAADASRLAPTLYLADRKALVPLVHSPDYVASLLALCEQHAIRAVLPLTDLDQSILTARRGDFVQLDLAATVDGEEVPGGTATNLSHEVGSNQLLPGLDEVHAALARIPDLINLF
jgi:hypothetical protein